MFGSQKAPKRDLTFCSSLYRQDVFFYILHVFLFPLFRLKCRMCHDVHFGVPLNWRNPVNYLARTAQLHKAACKTYESTDYYDSNPRIIDEGGIHFLQKTQFFEKSVLQLLKFSVLALISAEVVYKIWIVSQVSTETSFCSRLSSEHSVITVTQYWVRAFFFCPMGCAVFSARCTFFIGDRFPHCPRVSQIVFDNTTRNFCISPADSGVVQY